MKWPMPFTTLVHNGIWREIPPDEHDHARRAMRALSGFGNVAHSPQVTPLSGSAFANSFRLKVGRYRILFTLREDTTIVFQAAFLKRRESDYVAAIARHDAREAGRSASASLHPSATSAYSG